jgi:hypothetical protein
MNLRGYLVRFVCHAGLVSILFPPHWLHRRHRPTSGTMIVSGKASTFTSIVSGKASTFTSALCPQARQAAITARTPFLRMFPKVMGGPGFSRATMPTLVEPSTALDRAHGASA